jgi:hypothetical protein
VVEKRKTNVEISVGCSPIIISANGFGLGEVAEPDAK